jgi:hypothetical protein
MKYDIAGKGTDGSAGTVGEISPSNAAVLNIATYLAEII